MEQNEIIEVNVPVVTGEAEYIDVDETQKEFERLTGRSTLTKEEDKQGPELDLADPILQPHVTDPTFIVDVRLLAEKHGLDWTSMLNDMGLNTEAKLAAFMTNRSISEQIYTLSRELARIASKRGLSSTPKVDTLELTIILADNPDMVEFLKVLDTIVFPYLSEWERSSDDPQQRTLNPDWFVGKEDIKPKDEMDETVELLKEAKDQNMEIIREVEEAKKGLSNEENEVDDSQGLDVESPRLDDLSLNHGDGEVITGIDEADLVHATEHLEHEPILEADESETEKVDEL